MAEFLTCTYCSVALEYDAVSPFCDACWYKALHGGDNDVSVSMLRWIARVDE